VYLAGSPSGGYMYRPVSADRYATWFRSSFLPSGNDINSFSERVRS